MRQEFRLSGTGGQGLILAGIILAEAALLDGKLAIQSQSYGPEARGGASKSEVIISDEAIHFPKVTKPGVLLAMSQDYELPITHSAREGLGKILFANIIALGALVKLTGVVSAESLEKAVLNRVPKGTEDKNRKALEIGMSLIK